MSSVIMPTNGIHETAIIHPSAKLGKNVSVGPFAVIDEETEIGDGCVIGAHVTIHPYTKIGKNCQFFPGCSIGAEPQDLKFVGEKTYTIIGDGGSFRECGQLRKITLPDWYLRDLFASVVRPVKELKGYERVFLKAGEEKLITFEITEETLKFYTDGGEFAAETGKFELFVGGNSRDCLKADFELID